MRVGVIQSSFIPWRGYFDFIRSVDLFVYYEDVQYSKNSWRNRNRIKTPDGSRWVTVPVRGRSLSQLICETEIDDSSDWRSRHFRLWRDNYSTAPFVGDSMMILGDLGAGSVRTISDLNMKLTEAICDYLGIATPRIVSTDLALRGSGTERLISLLKTVGAKTYLSGPSADDYLDKEAFRQEGIALEYKSYEYPPYSQLWGPFEGAVTVLDLIANCGPDARSFIRSITPDKVMVQVRS